MKLSAKARYATRILLDLAVNTNSRPVTAGILSKNTGISVKFIEQILKPLRKAGLIKSVRGASGGYLLKQDPEDIHLGKIVTLMEGDIHLSMCCDDEEHCSRARNCRTRGAWLKVSRTLERKLSSITLADLMEGPLPECPGEEVN